MAKTIIPRRPLTSNKTDVPGPGAYHPKEINHGPSFKVGDGSRSNFVSAKETPGPAEYNGSYPHPKTTWTFGKGRRPPITAPKNYEDPAKIEKYEENDDLRRLKEEQLLKIKQKGPKSGWTIVGRNTEGTAGAFEKPV